MDQFVGRQALGLDIEALAHLGAQRDALGAAQEHAAALGDQRGLVVRPGRTRQIEQPLALGEAGRRVGVRIEEDVQVVERRHQLQRLGHQQAIAEHVAGHIADADHRDLVLLHVDAAFTEVPLHRNPAATRGDAHALVVVAGRAARGERIAQPEAVLGGNAVGDIGEGRGALIGRHHQVGVVHIVADHIGRRHHRAFTQVVGDIQQAGDEDAVAGDGFGLHLIAAATQRQAPGNEAALGAHRHDHRVLHLLGLDQTEHLGAVILFAVRPAQATAGHVAEAQVHPFDARAVYEDFELRHRPRNIRNRLRTELEAEVGLVLAVAVGLVEVGAQGGLDQVQVAPQDAVLVEHLHIVQGGEDGLLQLLLLVFQVFGGELARQVEARLEQPYQLAGDIHMGVQRAGDIAQVEAKANLLEVARIGTQQRHIAPRQAGGQHQAVEGIVLGIAVDDMHEGILQRLVELLDIHIQAFGVGEGEVVNPVLAATGVVQAIGELAEHAQAEVLQDRQHIGQRQRRIRVVELAVQLLLTLGQRLVEAHHQRALLGQAEQVLQVDHREMRGEALAVAGREAAREFFEDIVALALAEVLRHQRGVVVLPGAAGLHRLFFEAAWVEIDARLRVHPQDELHPRQGRFGEEGPELAVAGLQSLTQDLLDLDPRFGGIDVARHIGQHVGEAPVGVLAQEQADLVAFLDLHDGHCRAEQLVHRGLEQIVARQHFQHLGQFLAEVAIGIEARAPGDFADLAANERDLVDALVVHRGGEQPHEAELADHLALGIDIADRHIVRVGRAVHTAGVGGLGEGQQQRLAQVGDGVILYVQVGLAEAGAQQLGHTKERGIVIDHPATIALRGHGELFVTEEGEVVVQQPLEERPHLGGLLRAGLGLRLAQPGQQVTGLGAHRREIGHGQAHLAEHLDDRLLQRPQLSHRGAAVDLQVHQRLLVHILALAALGQQLEQSALGIAPHAQHHGLQGVDAVAATIQLHAHRVDQERLVRVQHLHRSMGGLPAVLLVVGIEHLRLGRRGVETLEQTPRRQRASDQVGQPALGQFVEGDKAEELLSEQGNLW
ncbi:MAG: hypothetical protein GAK43_02725 [Stenotrophomonas maltophilia]|nr:MAG: hypothetical protein GAK43_02725 [Stenotrophomonas maltophilia]